LNQDVENFLASSPFAETTKDGYRRVLSRLVELDLNQLDAAGLLGFVNKPSWDLNQRYTALCCCRRFIAWLLGGNHSALSARVKRSTVSPQPRLSEEQVLEVFVSFDLSAVDGRRDMAIACVALDCNLRATELCNLELGNVYLDRCLLFAKVKGGQWKWKTFSVETADYIRLWLEVREPALGVQTLFISYQHQRMGMSMKREGLQHIMEQWGKRVGFHISPHMWRRSYATISHLNGMPKNLLKLGGGWKDDKTVDHYIGDLELEATRAYLPVKKIAGR